LRGCSEVLCVLIADLVEGLRTRSHLHHHACSIGVILSRFRLGRVLRFNARDKIVFEKLGQ
jgi:hypothetical protein